MKHYYSRDGITLYHADCRDLLATLEPGSVDAAFTSPPYNLGTTTGEGFGHYSESAAYSARGGGGKWKAAGRSGGIGQGYATYCDAMPHDDYVIWQKEIVSAVWNVLPEDGALFYNHKPRVQGCRVVLPLEYIPAECSVRQVIIWKRSGGINFSPAFYLPTHEWVVLVAKERFRLKSKGASGVGDVWVFTQETNNEHPAPFPVDLPYTAIETIAADTILDPFAGSCTTGVAAWNLGRKAILCEISEEYCELGAKRLDRLIDQGRLFKPAELVTTQKELFDE